MSTPQPTQAAARERATRTFLTGLGVDVLVGIAAALLAWLPAANVTDRAAWLVLAATLVKTVLTSVAAYVLRLRVQPATEVDGAFVITDLPAREDDVPEWLPEEQRRDLP